MLLKRANYLLQDGSIPSRPEVSQMGRKRDLFPPANKAPNWPPIERNESEPLTANFACSCRVRENACKGPCKTRPQPNVLTSAKAVNWPVLRVQIGSRFKEQLWKFSEEINLKSIRGWIGGRFGSRFWNRKRPLFAVRTGARIGGVEF